MRSVVTTKQALQRIVGNNRPQGDASEFYKNYIFSEKFKDADDVYNLTVLQQQLQEYQDQLTAIDKELTDHAICDISE